ncbi:hypothetical protein N7447_005331 [Penicillium robsamsonii]|uniref:uncharacterized protein n=1 Tax=Penicillium robsamsonii TaxID=1792511 RepID=UPI0025486AF3|nr:uncharacterized protein N7447_005331 [Penicillium robsamsonii]KAJ5822991.1 hypothetical protein N7447_005331 [Penicillium robsamsonii]
MVTAQKEDQTFTKFQFYAVKHWGGAQCGQTPRYAPPAISWSLFEISQGAGKSVTALFSREGVTVMPLTLPADNTFVNNYWLLGPTQKS